MKCFLRDCETLQYLAPDGTWTDQVSQAQGFRSLVDLGEVALSRGLQKVLVLVTDITGSDSFEVAVTTCARLL